MPLKTFLATVEVRVVVNVPDDFTEDDFNSTFDMTEDGKVITNKDFKLDDVQVLDVSSDEHTDEDAEA